MDHRIGKFEVAVFDGDAGEPGAQRLGKVRKFADSELVAAAMAAQHHAGFRRQDRVGRHLASRVSEAEFSQGLLQRRTWSPVWVNRTGLTLSSLGNAARKFRL